MEERIVFLLFGTENNRQGMIATLKHIKTFLQLPAEQEKLLLYNRVLNRVRHMTDKEFESFMEKLKCGSD